MPTGSAAPDAAAFRQVFGRLLTGVSVVACVADGLDHAMTANSLTSVSLDPLLVLVCVETDSRFHQAVLDAGQWAVSVLAAPARPAAGWLATRGRPLAGQLASVAHHRGRHTGAALLDDALAWLEARTSAVHPAGDHSIVVGEVLGLGLAGRDVVPLTYFRGEFGRFAP